MTSRVLVRARLGTVLTFALAGMLCGVWVSRTPALAHKSRVGLGFAVVLALLIAASARFIPARRLMFVTRGGTVEPETVDLAA